MLSRLLKIQTRRKATLYVVLVDGSAKTCCRPGVGPGESFAPLALALVELLWRVAFLCGPQLAPMNVKRAFWFRNVFAGCNVFVAKSLV